MGNVTHTFRSYLAILSGDVGGRFNISNNKQRQRAAFLHINGDGGCRGSCRGIHTHILPAITVSGGAGGTGGSKGLKSGTGSDGVDGANGSSGNAGDIRSFLISN